MTGSGKTGLCLSLLEDAGIDKIPAIVIDPKGDIANLLLTFPELKPADFEPWIEPGEALRRGSTPAEFAKSEAKRWREGLADWDQEPERIRMFRDAVEVALYTPGSTIARPLSLLRELTPPPHAVLDDAELLNERISTAVSGLLGLLGMNVDPIHSREHILMSKLLEHAWVAGKALTLAQLIGQLQNPPFAQVGIMDLESFFPAKDRSNLAMMLNNLLASPSFSTWTTGEPIDISRLLYTATGKPKISILSISHLNDSQRMFFVTLLLNEVVSWMRTQTGTSSLRAILYMDEVFGFFPPVSNPPSKGPMLTLLKQARAFGLGVLLATQNPVDLDYKGLSNIGTWFLGRLQTERDKQRVMDGLEGATATSVANLSRAQLERILSALGTRKFLMSNVHDRQPTLFESRWALSYLRGPLSRDQLKVLVEQGGQAGMPDSPSIRDTFEVQAEHGAPQVVLPAGVQAAYVNTVRPLPPGQRLVYRPALLATGRLHFVSASQRVDLWEERSFLAKLSSPLQADLWVDAPPVPELDLEQQGLEGEYAPLPAEAASGKNFELWSKQFVSFLFREQKVVVHTHPAVKANSIPPETETEFRIRLRQGLLEQRDLQTEQLRKKFATKFSSLEGRIQRAKQKIETEQSRQQDRTWDTALSFGQTLLGAFMGRKKISATTINRTSSTIKKAGRAASGQSKVRHAEDTLESLIQAKEDLESEFQAAVDAISSQLDSEQISLTSVDIKPRKSDLSVVSQQFVWLPYAVDPAGIASPLYRI